MSKYNDFVTDRLQAGALAALAAAGVAPTTSPWCACPARSRFPLAAQHAAESGRFDAIVCLGCLIRGETPHFEYISSAVSHGLTTAAAATGVPMAFGVLTTNSVEEALARAGEGTRQQGAGRRRRRDRDGGGRRAARRGSGRRRRTLRPDGRAPRKDPATGPREAALQILYQWEIGTRDVDSAAADLLRAAVAERRSAAPTSCATFATALAHDTVERLERDRSADRRDGASAGGPSGWRCSIG